MDAPDVDTVLKAALGTPPTPGVTYDTWITVGASATVDMGTGGQRVVGKKSTWSYHYMDFITPRPSVAAADAYLGVEYDTGSQSVTVEDMAVEPVGYFPGWDYFYSGVEYPMPPPPGETNEYMHVVEMATTANIAGMLQDIRDGGQAFAWSLIGAGGYSGLAGYPGVVVDFTGDFTVTAWTLQLPAAGETVMHDATGESLVGIVGGQASSIPTWVRPATAASLPVLDGPVVGGFRTVDLLAYGATPDPTVGSDGGLCIIATTASFDAATVPTTNLLPPAYLPNVFGDSAWSTEWPQASVILTFTVPTIRIGWQSTPTTPIIPPLHQSQRMWPGAYGARFMTRRDGYARGPF